MKLGLQVGLILHVTISGRLILSCTVSVLFLNKLHRRYWCHYLYSEIRDHDWHELRFALESGLTFSWKTIMSAQHKLKLLSVTESKYDICQPSEDYL